MGGEKRTQAELTLGCPIPRLTEIEQRWNGAMTLAETIYYFVANKKTAEPEFLCLITFFGREKLKQLYLQEMNKRSVK